MRMTRWEGGSFWARTVAACMPPYEPPSTTTFWVCDSEAWLDGPEMEALLEDAAD